MGSAQRLHLQSKNQNFRMSSLLRILPIKKDNFILSKYFEIGKVTNSSGNITRGDFISTFNGNLGTQLQVVIGEFDVIGIATTGMVKKAVNRVEGDTGNAFFATMRF